MRDPVHNGKNGGNVTAMRNEVRSRWSFALACGLALFVAIASPWAHAASMFIVTEPWVRVAPNGRSAEGYMELTSTDGAKLVAVRSDITANVVMQAPGPKAAAVGEVPLPAGVLVRLQSGGYRVKLPTLNQKLKLGDRVEFVLTIESADGSRQDIPANAEVRLHSPTEDHKHPHQHQH